MDTDFAGSTPRKIHEDGRADFSDDVKVMAIFVRVPVHQEFESNQQGRPIFHDVDMVQIRQRGERDMMQRIVTEDDKLRWPSAWASYQRGNDPVESGTPLSILFPTEPAAVKMLAGLHFTTVEQLSAAPEAAIQRMGLGGRDRVNHAQRYLAASADAAPMHRMNAQMEEMASELETLRRANADLTKRNDELHGKAPKKA